MSAASPPPPAARPLPIRRRRTRPASRGSGARARSSSARPISISSRPDWSVCTRPMGFRATYSRPRRLGALDAMPKAGRLGVSMPGQRLFFGDRNWATAYDAALARFAGLGAVLVEIDIEPFYETARLLYEGPWLAERYLTVRS